MKEYYLIRVYGDVEPKVVAGPFSSSETNNGLVEHLKEEPYSEEDSLYLLVITNRRPSIHPFSISFMEECRRKAGEILWVNYIN